MYRKELNKTVLKNAKAINWRTPQAGNGILPETWLLQIWFISLPPPVTAFSSYLFAYTIHWCTSQRVSVFFSTLYLLILLKFIYFSKILSYYSPVPLFSLGRNPKNIKSVGWHLLILDQMFCVRNKLLTKEGRPLTSLHDYKKEPGLVFHCFPS